MFENERKRITDTLEEGLFHRIAHFGSTSIPGIAAKNTIDILLEVEYGEEKNQKLILQMKALGYDFNWQNEGNQPHMIFIRGYDLANPKEQTYHIHAGPKNHPIWDRLLFRDFLIEHPQIAKQYEQLKLKLSIEFKHDRVAYRIAKTDFIKEFTDKAKLFYQLK